MSQCPAPATILEGARADNLMCSYDTPSTATLFNAGQLSVPGPLPSQATRENASSFVALAASIETLLDEAALHPRDAARLSRRLCRCVCRSFASLRGRAPSLARPPSEEAGGAGGDASGKGHVDEVGVLQCPP